MARALKLNDEKQSTVVTLVSVGVSQRQAAGHVGCDPSTITKLAARDEEFAERLRGARMRSVSDPLELVKRHAEKSWRAAAWLLEKCHPHLYGKNASQTDSRALEDQRAQTVNILAEEIADPELLERIIDRLHQLDEQTEAHAEPQEECVAAPVAEQPSAELKPAANDRPQAIAQPAATANVSPNVAQEPTPGSRPATARRTAVYNLIRRDELHALYPVCSKPAVVTPLPCGKADSSKPTRLLPTSRDARRERGRRKSKRSR